MEDNLVKRLESELERLNEICGRAERQWRDAEEDRKAIARTIRILSRGRRSGGLNISADELRGMTQEQAVVAIAHRNHGTLRFGPAKGLLLEAGLIRTPKNAATILYTTIQRSGQFEQVRRGEYRLIEPILTFGSLPDWKDIATDEDIDPDDGPSFEELSGESLREYARDEMPSLRDLAG